MASALAQTARDTRLRASPKRGDARGTRRTKLRANSAFSVTLPSFIDLDECSVCRGSAEPGWTCEDHPEKPWRHLGCRGAGAPCVCNPRGAALWALVYSDALRVAEAPALRRGRSLASGPRAEAFEAGRLETSLG